MQKLNYLFVLLLLVLVSCKKDNKEPQPQPKTTTLKVTPKTFLLEAKKSQQTITIQTEKSFTANASEDWITISQQEKTKITFEVAENTTKNERNGTIDVTAGDTKEVITITQKGKDPVASIEYTIPSTEFYTSEENIKAFEKARGNTLVANTGTTPGTPPNIGTTTMLKFDIADDPVFQDIRYVLNVDGYILAGLYTKQSPIAPDDKKKFEDFLIQNGFKKITEKGLKTSLDYTPVDKEKFVHPEYQMKIELMEDKYNFYKASYHAHQQTSTPTFSSLPTFTKWKSLADVKQFEADNGGTYDASQSSLDYKPNKDQLHYSVTNGSDYLVARVHYILKIGTPKGLIQTSYYFDDRSLAFFTGLDAKSHLTNSFKKLMEDQGYTFVKRYSSGSYRFDKGTEKLTVNDFDHPTLGKVLRLNMY